MPEGTQGPAHPCRRDVWEGRAPAPRAASLRLTPEAWVGFASSSLRLMPVRAGPPPAWGAQTDASLKGENLTAWSKWAVLIF